MKPMRYRPVAALALALALAACGAGDDDTNATAAAKADAPDAPIEPGTMGVNDVMLNDMTTANDVAISNEM